MLIANNDSYYWRSQSYASRYHIFASKTREYNVLKVELSNHHGQY